MKKLMIDLETTSLADLSKGGVYRYVDDPGFKILLFAYSVDDGPVSVIDMHNGERIPEDVLSALVDPSVEKHAHNAQFERVCISKGIFGMPCGTYLSAESWICSMVWASVLGLPLGLGKLGDVLGLPKDLKKMKEGAKLIKKFSISRDFENPGLLDLKSDPDWATFIEYNRQDVVTEMAIEKKLESINIVPNSVWNEYVIDQEICDRGVLVDMRLVDRALYIDDLASASLKSAICGMTELSNPASNQEVMLFVNRILKKRSMSILETADKKALGELAQSKDCPKKLKKVIELILQYKMASVKKYSAIKESVCSDGRCRGMFMFYGASRSGRWAGRIVQLQNLRRNSMGRISDVRDLIKSDVSYEDIDCLFDSVKDVISQLLRTAFISRANDRFIVCDFSAIEARVIAWLAGEKWRMDTFANNGDIYCASASQMFKVPVEKHGVNGHLRQKGKVAELALGYGGTKGALISMGALGMGLTEAELPDIVKKWRMASPKIVKLWSDIGNAAIKAVTDPGEIVRIQKDIEFSHRNGCLFIRLPSGRELTYPDAKTAEGPYGDVIIKYSGIGGTAGVWLDAKKGNGISSYGPKLTENIVQAISRDLLCECMRNLRDHRICMHIHDELVIECPPDETLKHISEVMGMTPKWADGLLLRADGYETSFYLKD